jgi:hypothetical protein
MSKYLDGLATSEKEAGVFGTLPQGFAEKYPSLAEALAGLAGDGNGRKAVGAATISIFASQGELRFSIKPKLTNRVGFGSVAKPLDGLDGLEAELAEGRVRWKQDNDSWKKP